MIIIAITVVALAAMFAVLVMVAHRIDRRRQAKIELALIDRIIATSRRRRTAAEINEAWGKAVEKVAREEGRWPVTEHSHQRSVPGLYLSAKPPVFDTVNYDAIGIDMATTADETVAALVIHGVAVSRATASNAGVCLELASRSDAYQCEPSSDTGSSGGCDSYSPTTD